MTFTTTENEVRTDILMKEKGISQKKTWDRGTAKLHLHRQEILGEKKREKDR